LADSVILYTDGASRGNPGPAAASYILTTPEGELLEEKGRAIGSATNNQAEYTALVDGLRAARRLGAKEVQHYSDSELLIRQLNGIYQVKNPQLRKKMQETQALRAQFSSVRHLHVRREHPMIAAADALGNAALDALAES
jgi:ribonuclease HI